MEALETAIAWNHLHDPKVSAELNAEGILDLAKAAGYSEEAAQKMAAIRGFKRLEHNLPP